MAVKVCHNNKTCMHAKAILELDRVEFSLSRGMKYDITGALQVRVSTGSSFFNLPFSIHPSFLLYLLLLFYQLPDPRTHQPLSLTQLFLETPKKTRTLNRNPGIFYKSEPGKVEPGRERVSGYVFRRRRTKI